MTASSAPDRPRMKVAVTGGDGFLGWHLRCRLRALRPRVDVVALDRGDWDRRAEMLRDVDAVIHLAGINRADDEELSAGNERLARELLEATGAPLVIYANSIQAGNGTPYGDGKAAAARVLSEGMSERGGRFVDVRLPNLFGEHGRPRYNSFVATFVAAVIAGEEPPIQDRDIALLHAQDAAQVFIDALEAPRSSVVEPQGHPTSVQAVWDALRAFHATYAPAGDLPVLRDAFDVALFNTYRAALFPERYPIALTRREDARGWLVETVRAHGSEGQTFLSTTQPGITRGEHFHLRKLERFVVLAGHARIALRRMFTDEVIVFDVDGGSPAAVDMPIGWTHNLTNTGDSELLTVFWTNELFDPDDPDTHPEPVFAKDPA